MIASMTAYARMTLQKPWGVFTWELRAVNHRFLEQSMRLPETLREHENDLRETLAQVVHRGKVDCVGKMQSQANTAFTLNQNVVKQLANAAGQMKTLWPEIHNPTAIDILRWPEVLTMQETLSEEVYRDVKIGFKQCLEDFLKMRHREGEALRQIIEARLTAIAEHVADLKKKLPEIQKKLQQKLLQQVADLNASLDPVRLEQEWLLMAQKMDIAEELDRLQVHTKEMFRVLKEGGAIGRRLDFLTQELHREANTLCSKANDTIVTHTGVEMKVLIEQIREQVQNIE